MNIPPWALWREPDPHLRLRYAARILARAGHLEELIYGRGPPLDRALRSYQRQNRKMGRNDRRVLGTALYALARARDLYRQALAGHTPGEGSYLLLALMDHLGAEPGEVPELPGGASPWVRARRSLEEARARWAGVLDGAWDDPVEDLEPDVLDALAGLFSVPEWWIGAGPWTRVGEAVLELSALKHPQKLTLRVQPHRASREEVLRALGDLGVAARATSRSPWGLSVEGRLNVLATDVYRKGAVEIQDEGSQLVACLCDPTPGDRVLDLCAGGGGKALALASAMGEGADVVAYDPDPRRLGDTRRRARRSGLGGIRVLANDAEAESLGPYDLVLADVPCTSSGTLRRNPDVAWRWSRADLEGLVRSQAQILDRAARLLRPGGYLVYATCSLLMPENQGQAETFATLHPEFKPAPPGDRRSHAPLLDVPGSSTGFLRLPANLPHYEGDAFFLARFRREA